MQEKRKMQLGKFISIAITTLILFVVVWIIGGVIYDKDGEWVKWVFIVMGFIMFFYFASIALSILGYSIKRFIQSLKLKQEKGLWKILTLCFGIGLLLFGSLIAILWLVWAIYMMKDGLFKFGEDWSLYAGNASMFYMTGPHGIPDFIIESVGFSTAPFGIFVTSFVFILIWSAGGIAFEILKKILGGYRPKKNKEQEENNQA